MSVSELGALARELRARAELLDDDDWCALPEEAAPLPNQLEGQSLKSTFEGQSQNSTLEGLAAEVEACRKCPLGAQRIKPAFGVGSPGAQVVFVGEGPGYEEDRRGEPFVGKAGQLLDKILASIGLSRETVYIANVVKCHPMVDPSQPDKRGNDRPPTPDEMAACRGYLEAQLDLIAPRAVVALGGTAAKCLLATEDGVGRLRGRWHDFRGVPLRVTYHPAALLRDPSHKRDVWEDMKELKRFLEAA